MRRTTATSRRCSARRGNSGCGPTASAWRVGRLEGETPYRDIASVRLSYRPITMQTRRFVTEIRSKGGPRLMISSTSWRSLVEQGSQLESYSVFVRDLHARIAKSGGAAEFRAGLPALLYWPGLLAFLGYFARDRGPCGAGGAGRRMGGGRADRRLLRAVRVAERQLLRPQSPGRLPARRRARKARAAEVKQRDRDCEERAEASR